MTFIADTGFILARWSKILSEQFPKAIVLTLDRTDFSLYRRRDGTKVPCDFGPEK